MAVKGMHTNYQKTPRFSRAFAGDTERVYFIYGKELTECTARKIQIRIELVQQNSQGDVLHLITFLL